MDAETLHRLRSSALKLPQPERTELAHALIASLNAPTDPTTDTQWNEEILHRLTEVDAGTARYIDQDEFRRRMEARISTVSGPDNRYLSL